MNFFNLALTLLFLSPMASAKCRAILVNGGLNPAANYSVHETQLKDMYNSLLSQGCKAEDIFVFSASGSTKTQDFRLDPLSADTDFKSSDYKFDGKKRVANLYPADMETLKTQMTEIAKNTKADDKLFVYMSDHGDDNGTKKGLVPWVSSDMAKMDHEIFTEKDLNQILAAAPAETRVNIWADCCFCGVFNKTPRQNTCTTTSTDEYHPGSYFWTTEKDYTSASQGRAPFANSLLRSMSAKPTLEKAARHGQLSIQDDAYLQGSLAEGCFLGPRNSADQYLFTVIGFGDKKLCEKDLETIFEIKPTLTEAECNCTLPTSDFPEVEKFEKITDVLDKVSKKNIGASKARIQKLVAEMKETLKKVEESPELSSATRLVRDYTKKDADTSLLSAKEAQDMAANSRAEALKKYKVLQVFAKNQRLILEEIFKAKSNGAQKVEYERRKACLNEPLF